MSVRLFIKDNSNGHIREYGTNPHDSLILTADGSLHYENLQNCCGTQYPEEGYTFCLADGTDPRTDEAAIECGAEPYLDIGGDYYETDRPEQERKLMEQIMEQIVNERPDSE